MAVNDLAEKNRENPVGKRIKTMVSAPNRDVKNPRIKTVITKADPRKVKGLLETSDLTAKEKAPESLRDYILKIHSAPISSRRDFRYALTLVKEFTGYSGKKYKITEELDENGGEAAVFLAEDETGQKVVLKVYYDLEKRYEDDKKGTKRMVDVRTRVIELSKREDAASFILPILDVAMISMVPGFYNYGEIQPYCETGDLNDCGAMSYEELKPLIAHLNEGLHYIHQGGLIHMDIKPENLYEYKGNVVIGDFGISHVHSDQVRKTMIGGGSDGYRAPETRLNMGTGNDLYFITVAADYYSLGVTIASLYRGSYIFEGMGSDIYQYVAKSYLPLPENDDPKRKYLQNLINGLYQYDYNNRFGYEDVKKWLENPEYGWSMADTKKFTRPYPLENGSCSDELELFEAFSADWKTGKRHLYRNYVENFFAKENPSLASRAADIVEKEYPAGEPMVDDQGLFVFLTHLHPKGPLPWRGKTYTGLRELAESMRTCEDMEEYGAMLEKQIVSRWLPGQTEDETVKELVGRIEETAKDSKALACRFFGYAFSDEEGFTFLGSPFGSFSELLELLFLSPEGFYREEGVLDALCSKEICTDFYGYLYSCGLGSLVEETMKRVKEAGKREKAVYLCAMLDQAAEEIEPEAVSLIRNFYRNYGPFGYLLYLKELILDGTVYVTDDETKKELMESISGVTIDENLSVSDLTGIFTDLETKADRMKEQMENNPFFAEIGIGGKKAIECKNLKGMCCYDFLGTMVPIGYESRLRAKEEGACDV